MQLSLVVDALCSPYFGYVDSREFFPIPAFVRIWSSANRVQICFSSVVIPESIEGIHETAFARFTNLATVAFAPESCIQRVFGFRGCPHLRTVSFPADGQLLEVGGFCECSTLERIVIPASVVVVANCRSPSSFHLCRALEDVTFAENPWLRKLWGFDGCASLSVIRVPYSVEVLRDFCDCHSLEDVVFGDSSRVREIQGMLGPAETRTATVSRGRPRIRRLSSWCCHSVAFCVRSTDSPTVRGWSKSSCRGRFIS
jgi:hypothetical protein